MSDFEAIARSWIGAEAADGDYATSAVFWKRANERTPLNRNVRIVENSFARGKQGVHAELGRFIQEQAISQIGSVVADAFVNPRSSGYRKYDITLRRPTFISAVIPTPVSTERTPRGSRSSVLSKSTSTGA
jgi:hypothetical protein